MGECWTPNPLWVGVECEQPWESKRPCGVEPNGHTNVI